MALRTVGVRLTAEIGDYQNKLKQAGQSTRDFKGELDKAAKKGNLDAVANTAAGVGVALVGMAGYAIKSAADFDKAMSSVSAATHAPQSEINQLRAAALQAGKDTMYSATQAADGITELSKAGVSTADVLGGGLKGALSLAAAGQLSVGEAAETAASAMTQFKLAGDQVPHVADLLAAAAGKAQGSVHDMGYALSQSGLVAAQFGLSIEDTTGVLAEFANAGLIGSDAGTSFKTMLLAIANPSNVTAKQMQALGISFYDTQGKFVGLSGVAEVLRQKLGNLTDEQRQQALGQIFGNDAIRAGSILYADGAKGVELWKNKVNDSGYAAATAATQTNNLAGDLERLKGSLETLAIQAGSGGNSGLRILTKGLNDIVDQFSSLPPVASQAVTILAAASGAALLGLAGWVKLRKGIADASEQLIALGPNGEKAASALGKVSSVAAKASLIFAGLEAVELIGEHFHSAAINVDGLTNSLTNFVNTGKVAGELNSVFGDGLKDLSKNAAAADAASHGFSGAVNDLTSSIPGVHTLIDSMNESLQGLSLNKAKDNMAALDQALTNYMTTTNDARKSSDLWNQVLTQSGLDTDRLAALLPNAYKEVGALNAAAEKGTGAVDGLGGAAKGAAGKVGDLNDALKTNAGTEYKTKADAVTGALHHEADAFISLAKALRANTDPAFAFISAQQGMAKAEKDATDAARKHGATSKEAALANQKLVDAALNLEETAGRASSVLDGKLDPALVDTLKKAGATQGQIKEVGQQLANAKKAADKYTGDYAANISAPGAKQSETAIHKAYTAANGFAGPYVARLSIDGASPVNAALDNLLVKQRALETGLSLSAARGAVQKDLDRNRQGAYAMGGQVGGWSPHSRADNIPAWLTANEWVHPVDAVDYYGPQVMSAIQHRQVPREVLASFASGQLGKMGDLPIPGLAFGGQVGWKFADNVAKTKIPSWSEVLSHIPGGDAAAFLRAQDGKPYVWASAGPGGYDCSGIVSAVYNLLHGKSPYNHTFSTGSLPGGWFTKPGIGGPLTAAWSNPGEAPASSSTGHMMGMAGGLTFESTGSKGVHLGSTTRRLTDFAHIAHYANGGHVAMKDGGTITEPILGVGASGRTYSFGENYQPERVTPMWQAGAGGGGMNVHLTVINHGVIGSRAEADDFMAGSLDRLKRQGRA
jgi:TP901 family phage tail tape measure protein